PTGSTRRHRLPTTARGAPTPRLSPLKTLFPKNGRFFSPTQHNSPARRMQSEGGGFPGYHAFVRTSEGPRPLFLLREYDHDALPARPARHLQRLIVAELVGPSEGRPRRRVLEREGQAPVVRAHFILKPLRLPSVRVLHRPDEHPTHVALEEDLLPRPGWR